MNNKNWSLNPRDHNWEKTLESELPDCRVSVLNRDQHKFRYGMVDLDLVFCANCGEPQGAVWPDCPHVFFLCNDCAHGETPPGCVEVK